MLIIFFIYTLAWFFQAFTGFGAGIFIVGILSFVYDPKVVIVSSTIVNFLGIIFMLLFLNRFVKPDFNTLFHLILGSFLGIAISSKILMAIDREVLRVLIGLFILSLGIYDVLVQNNYLKIRLKKSAFLGILAGFLSGIFAGLIGMGGPPPVVYLNQIYKDVDRFKITLTFFFGTNVLLRIIFYIFYGNSNLWDLNLIIPAFFSVPLGVFLGFYLSRRVKPVFIKKFIAMSVFLLGALLTFEGFQEFLSFSFKH